ncbi:MAG TPA: glycosyltransferase family 4 protein [Chryseolinea sp.]|nr:glycosyltransferase family 4 protein [Chryseolinea sp.]
MTILNYWTLPCSKKDYNCKVPAKSKNILFLAPYPLKESPSQRFRFEQYFALLAENGFNFEVQTFLSSGNWKLFFEPGELLKKTSVLCIGFIRRLVMLFRLRQFDFIFIHREITPLGPPIFEWFISQLFRKKIIYDYDDAIWLTDKTGEAWPLQFAKWRQKVSAICRWSYKVSSGNAYLASFAKQYNVNVIVNPTTIDTRAVHNPALFPTEKLKKQSIVIGWTGSHSTLKYLEESREILSQIEHSFPNVKFMVIADRRPDLGLGNVLFVPWRLESEIQDLMSIDIGIMPLPNDKWAQGKCGFKALQYMALRIPAVASPVGVNNHIIDHGINGFLCSTTDEWVSALTMLIKDQSLRRQFGESGRNKIIDHYSVESNTSLFLKLFE